MTSDAPNDENETKDASGGESGPETASQYSPDELKETPAPKSAKGADVNLDLVLDVPVNLSLRAGSTDISTGGGLGYCTRSGRKRTDGCPDQRNVDSSR